MAQYQKLRVVAGIGLTAGIWSGVDGLWMSIGVERYANEGRAIAQVAPDSSFGTLVNGSDGVPCVVGTCTITGGTLNAAGSTLLHSLETFSLSEGEGAPAQIPNAARLIDPGVSDIVVRVTGEAASLVDGRVFVEAGNAGVGSTANLFLVNPQGIAFGPNARLDLGGAFVASTAQTIVFDGGVELATGEATLPTAELLRVSAPIGLGFLADAPSGNISFQGTGNRLIFGSPEDPAAQFVNRIFQQPLTFDPSLPPPGLPPDLPLGLPPLEALPPDLLPSELPPESPLPELPPGPPPPALPPFKALTTAPGTTLAFVASGIEFEGGNIVSPGGELALVSVDEGTVGLRAGQVSSLLDFDFKDVDTFADILLRDRALLDVSAAAPGQITLLGRNVSILDSSAVLAETLPEAIVAPQNFPAFSAPLSLNASASGGAIDINATETLTVSGFTQMPSIPLNPPFHSYLSVDVAPGASGTGGAVTVQAQNVTIDEGGQIGANTYGEGGLGRLVIAADETVALRGGSDQGPSGLFAVTGTTGEGNSGDIRVSAEHFLVTEGAQVLTSSFNAGTAGGIEVLADKVSLLGVSDPIQVPLPDGSVSEVVSPTLLQSTMGEASLGQSGDLVIEAGRLRVADGAEITTGTRGAGGAGDIQIIAADVEVSGTAAGEGPSTILTTAGFGATGAGGALTIETERLRVLEGGQVATGTDSAGPAGDLTVRAGESVLVSGQTALGRSGLFANAIGGSGRGGNLVVETGTLSVTDGGTLSVSNFASAADSPIPPGTGPAGDLQVRSDVIEVRGESLLSADTAAGDRGNITLQTNLLTLRESSRITTNATGESTGGNIDIDAPRGFVLAVPTENSDITANAVFGDGGRVAIEAQQVLGLGIQAALTEASDITASSEFGVAGEILLETPDTVVRDQVAALPETTEAPALAQGCEVEGGRGRFVQSGRGGLSASPYGILNGRGSLADVSLPAGLVNGLASGPSAAEVALDEAQAWERNEAGEVVLLTAAQANEGERCLKWHS